MSVGVLECSPGGLLEPFILWDTRTGVPPRNLGPAGSGYDMNATYPNGDHYYNDVPSGGGYEGAGLNILDDAGGDDPNLAWTILVAVDHTIDAGMTFIDIWGQLGDTYWDFHFRGNQDDNSPGWCACTWDWDVPSESWSGIEVDDWLTPVYSLPSGKFLLVSSAYILMPPSPSHAPGLVTEMNSWCVTSTKIDAFLNNYPSGQEQGDHFGYMLNSDPRPSMHGAGADYTSLILGSYCIGGGLYRGFPTDSELLRQWSYWFSGSSEPEIPSGPSEGPFLAARTIELTQGNVEGHAHPPRPRR